MTWIAAAAPNVYWPGANFHPEHFQVLPALARRFHEVGRDRVVLWVTGRQVGSSCMSTTSVAWSCTFSTCYGEPEHVNVGAGVDVSIRELAKIVASAGERHHAHHSRVRRPVRRASLVGEALSNGECEPAQIGRLAQCPQEVEPPGRNLAGRSNAGSARRTPSRTADLRDSNRSASL
jgi:hypothetical protein